MTLCDYGCGNAATHKFGNGKNCCALRLNQCPAMRKRKMTGDSFDNIELKLCDHGCGSIAQYKFKNNSICCSDIPNKCPSKAKKTGEAVQKAFQRVDQQTGKTVNQLRLDKIKETRKTKIDDKTGLPLDVARAYAAHSTKAIVQADGKTIQQKIADKISSAKKGAERTKQAGIKANATMKATIDPETGLTVKERATRKRLESMSKVGEDGLSGIERAIKKSNFRGFKMKQYKTFSIYYQGSHEFAFLEEQFAKYGSDLEKYVQRPKAIWYFDPTRQQDRLYFPDFIVNDKMLYEIKSGWTWNNNENGSELEQRNHAKLDAAKALGYEVHLILDKVDKLW